MGGMERIAVNLADAIAEEGHESHLLTCRSKPVDLLPARADVRVHRFDQLRALFSTGIGVIPFLISRLFLGVLIPKSHYIWIGWLDGWLLKRRVARIEKIHGRFDRIIFRGIGTFKYFWTMRDARNIYVLENILKEDRPRWQQKIEALLLFKGRHLVCVSNGVRGSVDKRLEETRCRPSSLRVIYNLCPVRDIRRQMLEPDAEIPSEPYIVNVARLVPQKGHRRLLEAYAIANPSELLVIVGEGEERPRLEELARSLGIEGRVRFVGQKQNPYPWMHHARLFVMSSDYEGLPLVLNESLACGTLIVSVDFSGGVRDVFKGELEPFLSSKTAEALAAKLSETLAMLPVTVKDEWLSDFSGSAAVSAFLDTPASAGGKQRP